jgi:hypothetical protein
LNYTYKNINGYKKNEVDKSVFQILEKIKFKFDINKSSELKNILNTEFALQGWVNRLKVDPRINWSIQYYFKDTAIIYYFSNKARSAIDLIKMQHLYNNGKIKKAVYIVLNKQAAKTMGDNLTNYETCLKEIDVFKKIINCPILIIGLG